MKKKAILIKDFHSADGALHAGETVIVEHELNGYTRVQTDMGKLFVVPSALILFDLSVLFIETLTLTFPKFLL